MNVVITGGAGFIGANLSARLLSSGTAGRLVVLDDLSTGFRENLEGLDGAELLEGSILDTALLDRAFAGADAVVHLAARSSVPRSVAEPMAAHTVNATGTAEVLEAARRAGGPHLVVASSSSVYGANPILPKHEGLATQPVSPYAASKLATEAYSLAWASVYGLDVLAFRFFNVFGPLQPPRHSYAAVVPAFLSALTEGRPLPVHGDGRQTRDFTFVGSVCAVIEDALHRRVTSATAVNLAFGSRISLLEVIAELEAIMGHPLPVEHEPPRPGDVRDTQADTSRLRELFPDAEPVGLTEGLAATVDWFRARA
ncbi:MAG TPA: NAD-dependent epimerase/dehydratase family protein [Acidimicrobiales bacterium]